MNPTDYNPMSGIYRIRPEHQFPHPQISGFQVSSIEFDPALPEGFYLKGTQTLNAPNAPRSAPKTITERIGLRKKPEVQTYPSGTWHPLDRARSLLPAPIYKDLTEKGLLLPPSLPAARQAIRTEVRQMYKGKGPGR